MPAASEEVARHAEAREDELDAALLALRPLEGTGYRGTIVAALEECRRILRLKLAPGASARDGPLLVVLAGGTNVGKTTVLNALAGEEIAAPSPIARATKAAVVVVHEDRAQAFFAEGFLEGYERRALASRDEPNDVSSAGALLIARHARAELRGLALADSPDIDSVLHGNRRVAWDLLYAADVVVLVASEEKYNDQVCVSFLERALRHGKAVIALLNKADAPEAAADLRDRVVRDAAMRAGVREAPPIFTLPFVRGASSIGAAGPPRERDPGKPLREPLSPLRAALHALEGRAPAVMAAARAGAARALVEEAAPALALLRSEAEALSHYRGEVREAAAAATRAYRSQLPELPIFEFDRVLKLLAEALRVPVIDDFYARLRAAGAPLGTVVRRLLGLGAPGEAGAREIRERDRRDLESAKIRLGEALAAVRRIPDRYPPEMVSSLRRGQLPSPEADALYELGPELAESLSREAERWVDGVLRELHARLRAHPNAVAVGKALKGTLRAAFATAAILATGHVGLEDVVIAPVVDLMVKLGLERIMSRAYFAEKRDEFYDARARVFGAIVLERAERLALGRREGGASAETVGRLERALEGFSGRERR